MERTDDHVAFLAFSVFVSIGFLFTGSKKWVSIYTPPIFEASSRSAAY